MNETVRHLLEEHGRLHVSATTIASDMDLYESGLTPFAAIRVMLALEERYDIEFPVQRLRRQTFASIDSIVGCLRELIGSTEAQTKAA